MTRFAVPSRPAGGEEREGGRRARAWVRWRESNLFSNRCFRSRARGRRGLGRGRTGLDRSPVVINSLSWFVRFKSRASVFFSATIARKSQTNLPRFPQGGERTWTRWEGAGGGRQNATAPRRVRRTGRASFPRPPREHAGATRGVMLSPKQPDTKRRRTLENLAMRKLAARKANAGATSADAAAAAAADGAARRVPFGAIDVNVRGVASTAPPAHVPARHAPAAAPPAPREDVMMDADFCCAGDDDDDMDFGAQESFGEWLSRVGLTRVTPPQRAELERVWGDASEVETLRELVENLKDSELEMARREQLAASGWAADFERATETAWRERVEAASAAESEAKAELRRNAAAADAARAAASEERCAAAAAAVESGQLRARLRDAMVAAEADAGRAAALQAELTKSREEAEKVERELFAARRARAAAAAAAEAIAAKMAEAESNFAAERDAYESTRSRAVERDRARDAAELERARAELGAARAAAAAAEAKLRETAADGADGRAALKAALELREREAERGRMRSDEARRRCATLEETTRALEEKLARTRQMAEAKVMELERALAAEKAARVGAERAEATAEEAAAKMKRRATDAVAAAEAKAKEAQKAAMDAIQQARARVAAAEQRAADTIRAAPSTAAPATAPATRAVETMSSEELRAALENITKAHAGALARAEAAEKRGRGLQEELAATKKAAAAAAANVAAAVASVRGSGRADDAGAVAAGVGVGVGNASFGVFAFDEEAVDVKRAELARIEGKVTAAKERLRATEEAALAAAAAAAATRTPSSNGSPRELPGASLPTPRTRARTALRLSHGPAPVAAEESPDAGGSARRRSPGSELRRRAVAMGLRASPFAPKRKRGGER